MSKIPDSPKNSKLINNAAIKDYLQSNPNFFDDNPDILELVYLPHKSGEAISLIERQTALLRKRNFELSEHINKLLSTAADNEKLFEKTTRLVASLVAEAQKAVGGLIKSSKPLSGILAHNELNFLFDNKASKVGSATAAALSSDSVFGILAIGNSNSKHYNSVIDTLFFSHITEVLNRLIPIMLNKS
jgi:uncharacterized protein YigA (DUF484 family)